MELSLCRQSQYGMLVYCSCSLLLQWPTLDPRLSIVPSYQPWKHMMILNMVIICIIHIITLIAVIAIKLCYDNYSYYCNHDYCWMVLSCRMVGVCWISCGIRAWLQETYPVCRPHSEYTGQTFLGACRGHWYYSAPLAQHLCGRSRGSQTRCRRWMPDVVRQLVGIGMVPWPVMNLTGLQRANPQVERFHVNTTHRHVWAMLPSALAVLWRFYLVLSAVHRQDKHSAKYAAL